MLFLVLLGVNLDFFFVGVIIFGSDQEVKALMRAVGRKGAAGHFSWIGSDGWSSRTLVS